MRTTRILASLALAAYLALVSAGAEAVLCVGANGHLAVELGCFGDLCSQTETSETGASTGQCGACVDTPLSIGGARATVQAGRSASMTPPMILAESVPLPDRSPIATTSSFQSISLGKLPAILRTTVLLI